MLATEDLTVEVAPNGEQALEMADSADHQYGIILMDVGLPGMSGIECAQRIRQLPGYGQTPIIAISAVTIPSANTGDSAGSFSDHLPKPFQKAALIAKLGSYLPGSL
jgi:CheY-like chemotaxis protein